MMPFHHNTVAHLAITRLLLTCTPSSDQISSIYFCLLFNGKWNTTLSTPIRPLLFAFLCMTAIIITTAAATLSADDAAAKSLVESVGAQVDAIFPTLAANAGAFVRLRLAAAAVALCLAQPQQQAVCMRGMGGSTSVVCVCRRAAQNKIAIMPGQPYK
jgi:hypothetical protein